MTHVDETSVWELIQQTDSPCALVHQIVKGEPWTHTLGSVELILAVLVLFPQLSRASRKLNEAKKTLIGLIFQALEPRIV